MSGAREDRQDAGRDEADQAPLHGDLDSDAQVVQDTRPGSAVGGHEPGEDPAKERDEMDAERQG